MKHFKIPVVLLICLLFVSACSKEQSITQPTVEKEVETPSVQPAAEQEVPKQEPTKEESGEASNPPEEPMAPAEDYYVGKNFKIYPANEENKKKIALITIDDAPKDAEVTTKILDILDNHHAKAIFFVNGIYVKKNPDSLLEIKKRGHIIGNHTWTHAYLRDLNEEQQRKEIMDVQTQIEELIGERPIYFRPPNGAYTDVSAAVMKEQNMQSMNWSVGSLDWELKKPEEVVKQVLDTMHNGANILFHDKQITSEALDQILTQLEEDGYTFVLPTKTHTESE